MHLTEKQKILVDACREKGELTKQEADGLLKGFYYYNHSKYVSEVISRLVHAKVLERVKTGVYRLREHSPYKEDNQISLF
jgi:hypothetical protein